jgi:hypothetical protein
MSVRSYFKGAQLVRMSNGDYCLVRPLGLVRGGKGMKHHDNLLQLTPRGLVRALIRALAALGAQARLRTRETAEAE